MPRNVAPGSVAARLGLARRRIRAASTIDGALALALLAVSLVFVASAGVSHARTQPVYGPIDEIYHVGYVERIAHSGLPPVRGDDTIVARPARHLRAGDVLLNLTDPGGFPVGFHDGAALPQVEAIQPPLYYYLLAPVALAANAYHTVFALRVASVVLMLAAVLLVFLAVRVTAPGRPLAAGLASMILGTMSGLVYTLSEVQNDALLITMFALVYWLLCRDIPQRRVSFGLAAAAGGLAITQIVAIPFAAAAILWASGRAVDLPRVSLQRAARYVLPRLGVAAAPLALWLAWNMTEYHSLLPGDTSAGPASAALTGPSLADLLPSAVTAMSESFKDFWSFGFLPGVGDPRPAPLLCFAFAVGASAVLSSGAISEVRACLATWTSFAVGAFASTFGTIFLAAAWSGAGASFAGRYFVGVAVAWAALVAVTIDAAAGRRAWVARSVTIVLSVVLLHFALQYSTLGFRLGLGA